MTFFENAVKSSDPIHWFGDMEADHYVQTSGIAGERFFKHLVQKGKFLGSTCRKCGVTYVPCQIYCEFCFSQLSEKDEVELNGKGVVESFTIVKMDKDGNSREKPVVVGLIRLAPNATPFLHIIGEAKEDELRIGMKVEAVLKPKTAREGRITDILYFRPV